MGTTQTYSFSSVGESVEEFRQTNRLDTNFGNQSRPVGIRTPLEFGEAAYGGLFVMSRSMLDAVKDNLRNIVQTNHGERLGHYDFGANLRELLFDLGSSTFDLEAMTRITTTVKKYLPYITLGDFQVTNATTDSDKEAGLAAANIKITYTVQVSGAPPQALSITLYAAA